jgi:hypothetical protein
VDATESAGDGLEGARNGRVPHWLSLKLSERGLKVGKCSLSMRRDLRSPRSLDLMQRAHGLGNRRGKVKQMGWYVRIPLKRAQPPRKRLSGSSR